jgi:alcohol dehydrogenase
MNLNFSYYMPTRILFGSGKLKELETTKEIPGKKALVVIGATGAMKKHGYLDRAIDYLTRNRVETVLFDRILPNPVLKHVDEGAAVARKEGCDFIIGLGGGSTIDSAKSIALAAANPGTYWDYVAQGSGGRKEPPNDALPIVAITTTAGTGTEADPWSVITKSDSNEKIGYGNDSTFPTLSIVDPELMLSVPPKTTAHTGMDAFFHSVEAYLATCNQPISDLLALEAISLISRYLPDCVRDGSNLEAREKLAWANTEAGICITVSSCISHHSIEHAVSAYYPEVPHGAGLTMLSLAYFSYLAERNPARYADMAAAMGVRVEGLKEKDQTKAFISAVEKLIHEAGLEKETLSAYGVKKDDLKLLAENSFYAMGGLYDVTPVKLTVDDVLQIYERAYT